MIRSSLTAALFAMAATFFCLAAFAEHPYFSAPGLGQTAYGGALIMMIAAVVGCGAMVLKRPWGRRLFLSAVSAALVFRAIIGAEGLVSDLPEFAKAYRQTLYWIVGSAAFTGAATCLVDGRPRAFSRFLKTGIGLSMALAAPTAITTFVLTREETMAQMAAALTAFVLWIGLSIQPKTFLRDPQ